MTLMMSSVEQTEFGFKIFCNPFANDSGNTFIFKLKEH